LAKWFAGDPDLSDEQRHVVETEEAWTLGVTAPRQRAASAPTPSLPSSRGREDCGSSGRRMGAASQSAANKYDYLRDPEAIYRRSFAVIRAETDLTRFPQSLR